MIGWSPWAGEGGGCIGFGGLGGGEGDHDLVEWAVVIDPFLGRVEFVRGGGDIGRDIFLQELDIEVAELADAFHGGGISCFLKILDTHTK